MDGWMYVIHTMYAIKNEADQDWKSQEKLTDSNQTPRIEEI